MSVFWAGDVQRLLEDLVLHRLATEQAFEVTNPLLQIADARRADDVLVGLDCSVPPLQHTALPGEELRGRDTSLAGDERNAHARLHDFLGEADLLVCRPPTPTLNGRDHFDPRERAVGGVRHSRTHRRMPMPSRLCHLSGQNGVHSTLSDECLHEYHRIPCTVLVGAKYLEIVCNKNAVTGSLASGLVVHVANPSVSIFAHHSRRQG